MGILDNVNTNNEQTTNSNGRPKKPAAKFWLNPSIPTTNPETGEEMFIGLPMGLPLDTMDPVKVTSRNDGFRAIQEGKNQLHAHLLELAENLKPGEEVSVNLTCRIRRVDEVAQEGNTDDAFKQSLSNLKLVG